MLLLKTMFILLITLGVTLACAPHRPRHMGLCKLYVDGTSDYKDGPDGKNSGSGSDSDSDEKDEKKRREKFQKRQKRKRQMKCVKYEDGSADVGAKLENVNVNVNNNSGK